MGFLIVALLAGCGGSTPARTQPPPVVAGTPDCPSASGPVAGAIVFGAASNLVAIDPDGANQQQIVTPAPGTRVLEPDWSPDGQTLAFVFSYPSTYAKAPWLIASRVCGIDRATGKARTLVNPLNETSAIEDVTWAPDGKALMVTVREYTFDEKGVLTSEAIGAARYDLERVGFTPLLQDSRAPMLSPDGSQLSYVYMDPATFAYSLRVADAAGQASQVITTSVDVQGMINTPRWSPDGKELLFSISSLVDGSTAPPGGQPPAATPEPSGAGLLDRLLGVEVARAHGLPADIWIIGADGSGQRRVTSLGLDDPRFDWDPAGGRIVYVSGFGGLTLVNLSDGATQRITDIGDFGGITWRK